MSRISGLYIDGQWGEPSGGEILELVNPATEEKSGELMLGSRVDMDRAVAAARAAFPGFAATSLATRIDLIGRIIEIYKTRFADIGESICDEMGAPLGFATRFQAGAGLVHFRQILKVLQDNPFETPQGTTRILHEAVGVCGMITPWNWPMNQMACKIAPALAAGCTMVLKPSELTPRTSVIMAEILHDAGVPPGVFNMVQGSGPDVGAALSAHEDIDMISFTGSTGAGIEVARAAAPGVKRVGQELGGKSANLVLPDADFAKAVQDGVSLCFRNAGQSCNSPSRLLVPRDRKDEACALAKTAAEQIRVGNPRHEQTAMGPVVSKRQWEGIQAHINSAMAEGATLIAGGPDRPDGLEKGYYVKPTVFADVTPQMTIAREEIFGPVLAIMSYESEEDAVRIANDSPFGLAGYVQSASLERARAVARKLRVGMVHINGAPADPAAPFGGTKASGNGREWGRAGLEEFMETKAVMGYEK